MHSTMLPGTRRLLALAACGVLTAAGTAVVAPPAMARAAEVIDCAQSAGGLGLTVITDKDRKVACDTGAKVGDAYAAQGFSAKLSTVYVGNEEWDCQLVQGGPNDFPTCDNGSERVRLSS